MRDLIDLHYPRAERIRVVLDNLSTHSAGALYQTFPAPEAESQARAAAQKPRQAEGRKKRALRLRSGQAGSTTEDGTRRQGATQLQRS